MSDRDRLQAIQERAEKVRRTHIGWSSVQMSRDLADDASYLLKQLTAEQRAREQAELAWARAVLEIDDVLKPALEAAERERDEAQRQTRALVDLESGYRQSEQMMLRRLSDILTGGNAQSWEEVCQAAEAAEAQGPATGWQPSEAIGPLNGVRQAIDEAWLDIAEWQRLAREQRAAHPNPNHAPKMPSEAGIQKSERVRQNLALADVALVTLAKLLAPSGGSAPPPVCTRGKSSSAIGTARRATTIARRQRSR
jgi:hypothetical protein